MIWFKLNMILVTFFHWERVTRHEKKNNIFWITNKKFRRKLFFLSLCRISKATGWKTYIIYEVFIIVIFFLPLLRPPYQGFKLTPELILLVAWESTAITSHSSCLTTAHGTNGKQSGRCWSSCRDIAALKRGIRIEDKPCHPSSVISFPQTHLLCAPILEPNRPYRDFCTWWRSAIWNHIYLGTRWIFVNSLVQIFNSSLQVRWLGYRFWSQFNFSTNKLPFERISWSSIIILQTKIFA